MKIVFSKTWNELYEMSTETFVEETEQSKQTGAGPVFEITINI